MSFAARWSLVDHTVYLQWEDTSSCDACGFQVVSSKGYGSPFTFLLHGGWNTDRGKVTLDSAEGEGATDDLVEEFLTTLDLYTEKKLLSSFKPLLLWVSVSCSQTYILTDMCPKNTLEC